MGTGNEDSAQPEVEEVQDQDDGQVVVVVSEEEERERAIQEEWDQDFGGRIGEAARAALHDDTAGQFHRLRLRGGDELNVRPLRTGRR